MSNQLSYICKMLYGSKSLEVEQGLKFRLDNDNYIVGNRKDITIERIKLVVKTFLLPIEFLINKNSVCPQESNQIFGAGTKEIIYEGCINHYFDGNAVSVYDKHYYKEGRFNLTFWKWYVRFLAISIRILFGGSNYSFGFMISVYRNLLSLFSVSKRIDRAYGFFIYNPVSYLTMACLTGNKVCRVYAMFEVFLEMNKYFTLPVEKGYFLSKIMLEEVNYYKEWPHFYLEEYEYLGSINMFEKGDTDNYKYEIGFFSTGAWARKNGEDRALDCFKSIEIGNSLTASCEHNVFCALAQYAKKNGIKLKYYMHPYEKDIYQQYGELAPEYELVDNINVFFENSNDKAKLTDRFNEVFVAVAVRSTSIMERFNLGHSNNYMYDYKNILPCTLAKYDKEALGNYEGMFYKDEDDLVEKISRLMHT